MYLQVLLLASFFPIVIIKHVSELYSYNSLLLLSIIVGAAVAKLYQLNSWIGRFIIVSLFAIFIVGNMVSVSQKAKAMKENGNRALKVVEDIIPYILYSGKIFEKKIITDS